MLAAAAAGAARRRLSRCLRAARCSHPHARLPPPLEHALHPSLCPLQTLDVAELDFSRYGDTLFEVAFVGARLTTGGSVATEGKKLDINVGAGPLLCCSGAGCCCCAVGASGLLLLLLLLASVALLLPTMG